MGGGGGNFIILFWNFGSIQRFPPVSCSNFLFYHT